MSFSMILQINIEGSQEVFCHFDAILDFPL